MSHAPSDPSQTAPAETAVPRGRRALLERHRWLVFVLPLAVYMVIGSVEPRRVSFRSGPLEQDPDPAVAAAAPDTAAAPAAGKTDQSPAKPDAAISPPIGPKPFNVSDRSPEDAEPSHGWLSIPYRLYPLIYTIKIALTLAAILLVLPGYGAFPVRVSPLAVLVGAAGIIVWIGICNLRLEERWLAPMGFGWLVGAGVRLGFDPLWAFAHQPAWQLWMFLAVRLFGLVVVVAVIEEFFLRGFLMRLVVETDWWKVPIGRLTLPALVACIAYAVLSHPAEMFAAMAWFLLVTLLAVKTKNIWDCVVAHATTNLLLGVYILVLQDWKYW